MVTIKVIKDSVEKSVWRDDFVCCDDCLNVLVDFYTKSRDNGEIDDFKFEISDE